MVDPIEKTMVYLRMLAYRVQEEKRWRKERRIFIDLPNQYRNKDIDKEKSTVSKKNATERETSWSWNLWLKNDDLKRLSWKCELKEIYLTIYFGCCGEIAASPSKSESKLFKEPNEVVNCVTNPNHWHLTCRVLAKRYQVKFLVLKLIR